MQTTFRYFTGIKILYVLPMLVLCIGELMAIHKRNPFCFSDSKIKVPFCYNAIAKVHNCSKSFAILTKAEIAPNHQNIIAKKGDIILGYQIIDICDDMLIVQDTKNNEIIVHLK